MNNILKKFEDLAVPIKEIYNNLNYKDINTINKMNEIVACKKLIYKFDVDIDNCILYALNFYDNLNNFIIFGLNSKNAYTYYLDNFKNDYSLFGIKYLKISSNLIIKIMYQLLFSRMIIKTKNELLHFIEANYGFLHKYDKEFIDISILIVCKKDLKKKYPLNDIISNDYIIYIPNTKESIWNCASIFFSETSLKFIEIQNFDYFLTKDMKNSKKMFLKYRNWLNTNIDGKNQMQFMLFSSIVLYLIGNRAMNDLDLYIHTIPSEIIKLTHEFKTNEVFNFIEYKIKNTDNWPNYWDSWLDTWAQKCGAKYFEEILCNPKYHFYFLGVKIISLECDVIRRLERGRPRAIADLIALRKRYGYNVIIPPIQNKIIKFIPLKDKLTDEINELIKKGGILNKQNEEISIEVDNDVDKCINTIIYALNTRYRMTFTTSEIKKELNMSVEREDIFSKNIDNRRIKISIKKK